MSQDGWIELILRYKDRFLDSPPWWAIQNRDKKAIAGALSSGIKLKDEVRSDQVQ